MTELKLPMFAQVRSTKMGHSLHFATGLVFGLIGYFFWQFVAAFVGFFTFGSGAGHDSAAMLVGSGCLAVHVGLLSWLFRRQVLYTTWVAWAVNVGLALGLFAWLELYRAYQL